MPRLRIQTILLLVCGCCLVSPAVAQQAGSTNAPALLPSSGGNAVNLTPEEWQKLRTARAAALQANPDLTAASQRLNDKIHSFQDKLNAAMIKADPKVAPIISKIEMSRPHLVGPVGSPSAK